MAEKCAYCDTRNVSGTARCVSCGGGKFVSESPRPSEVIQDHQREQRFLAEETSGSGLNSMRGIRTCKIDVRGPCTEPHEDPKGSSILDLIRSAFRLDF